MFWIINSLPFWAFPQAAASKTLTVNAAECRYYFRSTSGLPIARARSGWSDGHHHVEVARLILTSERHPCRRSSIHLNCNKKIQEQAWLIVVIVFLLSSSSRSRFINKFTMLRELARRRNKIHNIMSRTVKLCDEVRGGNYVIEWAMQFAVFCFEFLTLLAKFGAINFFVAFQWLFCFTASRIELQTRSLKTVSVADWSTATRCSLSDPWHCISLTTDYGTRGDDWDI